MPARDTTSRAERPLGGYVHIDPARELAGLGERQFYARLAEAGLPRLRDPRDRRRRLIAIGDLARLMQSVALPPTRAKAGRSPAR